MKAPMMNLARLLMVLTAFSVTAAETMPAAAKPPKPEKGNGRYLVILWDAGTPIPGRPGEHMKKIEEPDIAKMGGKVLYAHDNERLIDLPVKKAKELRKHEAVSILQRLWEGEPLEELKEESETSSARHAVETDADTNLTWGPKDYTYDDSGNITAIGTDSYTYDTAGRLIQARVGGKTETYKYDEFGNLLEKAVEGSNPVIVPVDASSNRVIGASYDTAGNMTTRQGATAYSYDSMNMLSTYKNGRWMIYDVNDERIGVIDSSTARWSIRGFDGQVLREYRGNPNFADVWAWEQDYVYADGRLVGGERAMWLYGDEIYGWKRHYHLDHLGSVRVVTDNVGRSVSEHDYYPFGVTPTKAYQEQINWVDPYIDAMRYAGHQREFLGLTNAENTDYLDYMHARYYDPNLGRFLSVDKVGGSLARPQSWNRYSFVRNNPLRRVDPDGNKEIEFTIRHFIPDSTVQLPHGRNLGDGRNFSLHADASVRTERTIRIETDPAVSRSGVVGIDPPRIGRSENLTFGLSGRASGASMTAEVSRIPGAAVLITTTQNEAEPVPMSLMAPQAALFVTGRGGIRSTVNILVSEDASRILVFGSRSSFPAMEINATVDGQTFAIYRGDESQIPGGFGIFGTESIDRKCTNSSGPYTCK